MEDEIEALKARIDGLERTLEDLLKRVEQLEIQANYTDVQLQRFLDKLSSIR